MPTKFKKYFFQAISYYEFKDLKANVTSSGSMLFANQTIFDASS